MPGGRPFDSLSRDELTASIEAARRGAEPLSEGLAPFELTSVADAVALLVEKLSGSGGSGVSAEAAER